MTWINCTLPTEFMLVGLSEIPSLQSLLFVMFFSIYIVTLLGNICIIFAYQYSSNLHTPMYFFLANFSFLDICYISTTVPNMLYNFLHGHNAISFYGCVVQLYFLMLLGSTECYILAAMAYDRYNAICRPLRYTIIMNKVACTNYVFGSWVIGIGNSVIHTTLTFTLPFCSSTKINYFFCDIPPLLNLVEADTSINELATFIIGGFVTMGSLLLTIISYSMIISTIVKINSSSGRKKAFSTCVSHFTVVTIFYGSGIFIYLKPKSNYIMDYDRLVAVMYTVIAPLLNPFIYSLRNNDVKVAVRKLVCGGVTAHKY
ncbi:PREDICTED: olfactory receptor 5V1-like [Nanorana parkeri]|uniref:olfactory receptor 5V1-like n=1 Tax=Nanorana parkeri TaxID=125878 RepID=UPI0008548C2D|nr:PREDICTED: olfactory receptor 5V1-like [Nanorana parkeri]